MASSILIASRFGIAEAMVLFSFIAVCNVGSVIAGFLMFSKWQLSPLPLMIGILVVTVLGLKFLGGITLFAFPGLGSLLMITAYFIFRRLGWA